MGSDIVNAVASKEIQEAISVDQRSQLLGSLLVDYDKLAADAEEGRDFYPEDILAADITIKAFGCIQPVDIKKLSNATSFTVQTLKKYKKLFNLEIEKQKEKSKLHLQRVADVLDFSKLFRPSAPIAVSEFVRKVVLDQKLQDEESNIIKINNIEINMTDDRRNQIINTTAGQKELFFSGETKQLPKQTKPTDEFLSGYIEDMKGILKEKSEGEETPDEDNKFQESSQ